MTLNCGTIGELQSRMTYPEFLLWCEYRSKYGPLNPVRRYDQGSALIASAINNSMGGKATPNDYIFYGKDKEGEGEEPTLDEFVKALGPGVKIGR